MRLRTRLAALASRCSGSPVLAVLAADPPAPKGKPLAVLFLGDNGQHRPADRSEQLAPVLAGRGIDVTYTEKVSDLNPETLGKYDALMIYANTTRDRAGPGEGAARLRRGRRRLRPAPLRLVLLPQLAGVHRPGRRAVPEARHGRVRDDGRRPRPPDHEGPRAVPTWDETYVHTKHNDEGPPRPPGPRRRGRLDEPWTWVRTQGKGRVFYTACGHDARTWGHPGFQDLLERGIRWAANKGDVFDTPARAWRRASSRSSTSRPRSRSTRPARSWGTLGEPIRKMQKPLDPAESMQAPGRARRASRPKLFAAEPRDRQADLHDLGRARPALDRRDGRLSQRACSRRARAATGSSICEDTDGDGKADKFTVFADKLSIPTSLCFANGGVIVAPGPGHAVPQGHRRRRQGRRAQGPVHRLGHRRHPRRPEQPALRASTTGSTAIVGYSGFDGDGRRRAAQLPPGLLPLQARRLEARVPPQHEQQLLGRRLQRGGPRSSARRPTAARASTCRSPTATTSRSAAGRRACCRTSPTSNRFFPITEKVRQVDWHGGFTAGAGHALYTARTYPEASTGTAPRSSPSRPATSSRRSRCTRDGSDFALAQRLEPRRQRRRVDLADRGRGRPRRQRLGDRLVQLHRPAQPDARRASRPARANAYETPLRDKTHGRIYRIVDKDGKPSEQPKLLEGRPEGAGRGAQERQHVLAAARPAAAGRARQDGRRGRPARARRATSRSTPSA